MQWPLARGFYAGCYSNRSGRKFDLCRGVEHQSSQVKREPEWILELLSNYWIWFNLIDFMFYTAVVCFSLCCLAFWTHRGIYFLSYGQYCLNAHLSFSGNLISHIQETLFPLLDVFLHLKTFVACLPWPTTLLPPWQRWDNLMQDLFSVLIQLNSPLGYWTDLTDPDSIAWSDVFAALVEDAKAICRAQY